VAGGGAGNNLLSQYQSAMNRANQANEARYQDVLGGYQQRYQRGMDMLSGLGQQQSKDINELYDQQQGNINNNLINSGLMNSSVASTMAMGNNRERNADLGRLNDSVRQQAMAADAGLSGDTLQFMERKTEAQPNVALLAQIMQSLGVGGYGGGGIGGIGGGAMGGAGMGGAGGMAPPWLPPWLMPPGGAGYGSPNAGFQDSRRAAARANYAAQNQGKQDASNFMDFARSMTNPSTTPNIPPVTPWSGGIFDDAYANWAAANGGEDPLAMNGSRYNAPFNPDTSMNVPYGY
jgi:DNA-binding XRE family transcriptional regulator